MLGKKRERITFNEKMNPKNFYFNNPPDFKKLSQQYPEFSKYVYQNQYGSYSINWKNKQAVKELCRILLKNDFQVDYWDIPDGYLIPSITSRCNYIHWIHDLLEESNLINPIKKINGLDIGIGANCIYPLLGSKIYSWNFKCSDVNPSAIEIASIIIRKNKLDKYIRIVWQEDENKIFENVIDKNNDQLFYFTMCNPPYFSKEEEIKHDNPNTVSEYHEKEVYCKGGEFEFIKNMIEESKVFKNNVLWFTTLVGKKINFDKICGNLKIDKDIKQIKSTTFYQGKLARWGIAWSFINDREIQTVIESNENNNNKLLNFQIKNGTSENVNINLCARIRLTHKKSKYKNLIKDYGEL